MINDNVLGNRLNEFKRKQGSNEPPIPNNPIFAAFSTLFTTILIVFKTLVFGYGIKIIFSTDWNFWEIACIGVMINFFLTFIHDLIHNN
jgi:hypothetical protein